MVSQSTLLLWSIIFCKQNFFLLFTLSQSILIILVNIYLKAFHFCFEASTNFGHVDGIFYGESTAQSVFEQCLLHLLYTRCRTKWDFMRIVDILNKGLDIHLYNDCKCTNCSINEFYFTVKINNVCKILWFHGL